MRMLAVAVRRVAGQRQPTVTCPAREAGGELAAQAVEAAAVDPQIDARRAQAGRRDAVDRAAQRGSAEAQRVRAAEDLNALEDQRVEFLEIAIVVGQVDWDAVLKQ